jgi:hypothetical protein
LHRQLNVLMQQFCLRSQWVTTACCVQVAHLLSLLSHIAPNSQCGWWHQKELDYRSDYSPPWLLECVTAQTLGRQGMTLSHMRSCRLYLDQPLRQVLLTLLPA